MVLRWVIPPGYASQVGNTSRLCLSGGYNSPKCVPKVGITLLNVSLRWVILLFLLLRWVILPVSPPKVGYPLLRWVIPRVGYPPPKVVIPLLRWVIPEVYTSVGIPEVYTSVGNLLGYTSVGILP